MASHEFTDITRITQIAVDQWNATVLPEFHRLARIRIQQQVSRGNNQFNLQIDGKASTYEKIDSARKIIRVVFTRVSLRVALKIVREQLSKAIRDTTITRTGRLNTRIEFFLARQNSGFEKLKSLDNFELNPGDILAVVPVMPYAPVVNRHVSQRTSRKRTVARDARRAAKGKKVLETKSRGQGFMALASQRINSEIGNLRGLGSISVSAGFSKAISEQHNIPVYGRKVNNGVPAIFISYRYLQKSTVIPV